MQGLLDRILTVKPRGERRRVLRRRQVVRPPEPARLELPCRHAAALLVTHYITFLILRGDVEMA